MKIIYLIFLSSSILFSSESHKRYVEIMHPTPSEESYNKVPDFMLNDIPTPVKSNFENILTTIDEEDQGQPTQNESSIAVNPVNPDQLIASAVDYRSNGDRWVYLSSDGGRSWFNQNLGTVRENWRSSNDPSVAFSWDGWGYLMYGGILSSTGPNGVYLAITKDFGENWDTHIPVIEHVTPDPENLIFDDKYYVELDNSAESPYKGYVYTPWKRMTYTDSATQIMVARSTDRGYTWDPPVPVSARKPNTIFDTTFGQSFPLLATGRKGELYSVWNDGLVHGVGFNKSYDGGLTWEDPRIIQNYEIFGETRNVNGAWQHRIKDNVRAETYPVLKVDLSGGERDGNLYLTWAGGEPPNIYFSRSEDEGDTWTDPVLIHADSVNNDQWWQWLDVDPITGDLAIMFMDSRNDPDNIWAETWVAYSSDGGDSWIERQVSDFRSDLRRNPFTNNVFAGDYNGCAFYDGIIYPSWVDMRNSTINGSNNDVYTSIVDINAPAVPSATITEMYDRVDELEIKWDTKFINSFFLDELNPENIDLRLYINEEDFIVLDNSLGIDTLTGLKPFDDYSLKMTLFDNEKSKESGRISFEKVPGISQKPNAPEISSIEKKSDRVEFEIDLPTTKVDDITPITNIEYTSLYRDGVFRYFFDQNVPLGSTIPMSDNPEEVGYYRYSFKTFVRYNSPEGRLDSSDATETFLWFGEDRSNILQNFEETNNQVYTNKWEITDSFSKNGNYSITDSKDGDYIGEEESFLLFPKFKRDDNENPLNLIFWNAAIIGFGDKGIVEISKDLENWSSIIEYNKNDFAAWGDSELNQDDWRLENISLTELVEPGEEFYIRLNLVTNSILDDDGWYIDDLYVRNAPLSVEESLNELQVYPNPAKDKLHLNFGKDYHIYDIYGNLILSGKRNGSNTSINISSLIPGSYFIKVGNQTQRFIKL